MCENCIYAIETDIDGLIDCQIDGRSKDYDMRCERFLPKFSADELIRELKKAKEDSKNSHFLDDMEFRKMDLTIEKPIGIKTRFIIWWLNLIDEIAIRRWERKH